MLVAVAVKVALRVMVWPLLECALKVAEFPLKVPLTLMASVPSKHEEFRTYTVPENVEPEWVMYPATTAVPARLADWASKCQLPVALAGEPPSPGGLEEVPPPQETSTAARTQTTRT